MPRSWVRAELTKPQDDSELSYIHVMFQWDAVDGSTEYNFQFSSNPVSL